MSVMFCVTARNRLTGEREVVTKPIPQEEAESIKLKMGLSRSSDRPYTHPKVDPYNPQLELFK